MTETGKYVKHMTKLSKRPLPVEKQKPKVTVAPRGPQVVEKQAKLPPALSKRPKKK